MAGSFVTYTMITPILRDRYSAGPHLISVALLVYGIAGIGGNLIVGRAATSFSAERLLAMAMIVLLVVFAGSAYPPHLNHGHARGSDHLARHGGYNLAFATTAHG